MPPFPPQGAIYLTLLSRHSLGNGTMVMLVLLSLRWGMKIHVCRCPAMKNTCYLAISLIFIGHNYILDYHFTTLCQKDTFPLFIFIFCGISVFFHVELPPFW
ncbi:MAG: hypothetical protein WBI82_06795 [Sphaerochaeta sp.]